ncbi:DUF5677 domain-containing protein [Burkholderia cepacia]|uniref:DUF5677 domain-containing protein n=1 Tax=Burkholderia cepacia TaxID=292 RepID=UPI000756DBF8|nr:DUF5677 domain-containing protein [Burkholderia cepacia]KVL12822.1 hypothetical protein WJ46_28450 [Burkholderia cepacia]KVQ21249.1 hypothetical protein WK02_36620 [Burkholderia cepacia]KVZ18190.1 hypothetical protein WL14_29800 [Burkholderia cepacia]
MDNHMESQWLDWLGKHTDKHDAHFQNLTALRENLSSLSTLLETAIQSEFSGITSHLKRVECFALLTAIDELNDSMLDNIEKQRFSAAEAIARITLEHTVNFLYVLDDPTSERALSLLKQHFFGARERAKKWHGYLKNANRDDGVKVAEIRLKHLKDSEELVPELAKAKPWPDARRRFQALDLEHFYHDLFTPASDSVHTLAEDVFNLFMVTHNPQEHQDLAYRSMRAEKISFAIYLCASVLSFYAEAVCRLAIAMGNEEMEDKAMELGKHLSEITISMNDDTLTDLFSVSEEPWPVAQSPDERAG